MDFDELEEARPVLSCSRKGVGPQVDAKKVEADEKAAAERAAAAERLSAERRAMVKTPAEPVA